MTKSRKILQTQHKKPFCSVLSSNIVTKVRTVFTICPVKSSNTFALVVIDEVLTGSIVLTGTAGALIDIYNIKFDFVVQGIKCIISALRFGTVYISSIALMK